MFPVGGREGWVHNPSESYNHWAQRMRFHVHDTLVFRYKKREGESVLVVTEEDYYSCNTSNPIQKLEDGNSKFKFDRSGPFFFVSGKPGSCERGHKLVVVVMAVRSSPPIGSPAPAYFPIPSRIIPYLPPPPSQAPSSELPSSPPSPLTPAPISPSGSETSPSSPTSSAQLLASWSFEFSIGWVCLLLAASMESFQ